MSCSPGPNPRTQHPARGTDRHTPPHRLRTGACGGGRIPRRTSIVGEHDRASGLRRAGRSSEPLVRTPDRPSREGRFVWPSPAVPSRSATGQELSTAFGQTDCSSCVPRTSTAIVTTRSSMSRWVERTTASVPYRKHREPRAPRSRVRQARRVLGLARGEPPVHRLGRRWAPHDGAAHGAQCALDNRWRCAQGDAPPARPRASLAETSVRGLSAPNVVEGHAGSKTARHLLASASSPGRWQAAVRAAAPVFGGRTARGCDESPAHCSANRLGVPD